MPCLLFCLFWVNGKLELKLLRPKIFHLLTLVCSKQKLTLFWFLQSLTCSSKKCSSDLRYVTSNRYLILILNLTPIGFTIFLDADLSFFTNADVVTIKDETWKKICETHAGPKDFYWFPDFFSFLQMLML